MDLLPKTELKALPDILQDGEHVKYIVRGLYKNRNGVLVATTERIIFFDKGRIWGIQVEEFQYEDVTSVEYSTGIMSGEITIYVAGNTAKIDYVAAGLKPFVDTVRRMMNERRKAPTLAPDEEFLAKLERLAALKSANMLTDEEFRMAKAKLLNLSS